MTPQLLIVLMSVLGVRLALNPTTTALNTDLLKGATWLFRGLVFRFLK